jgi:hypothetical protein
MVSGCVEVVETICSGALGVAVPMPTAPKTPVSARPPGFTSGTLTSDAIIAPPDSTSPGAAGIAAVLRTACAIPGAATAMTSMAIIPKTNTIVDVIPDGETPFILSSNINYYLDVRRLFFYTKTSATLFLPICLFTFAIGYDILITILRA